MNFTKDSGMVKNVWVPLIISGVYEEKDVPALGNLQEVVSQVIAELK